MKCISILTPVYNEEGNINRIYERVKEQFENMPDYTYEHIFIDNCSTDSSRDILRALASEDSHVRVILNARNFGPNRSIIYGMFQGAGECLIVIPCDLQDPPELIPEFVSKWEEGYKVVLGQKKKSNEGIIKKKIRNLYYAIMSFLADTEHLDNVTGFGLYDKEVLDTIQWIDDPDPYIRGLIPQLGYKYTIVSYVQQKREAGKSSYNFFRYFDYAITGMVHVSKKPIRIATLLGIIMSFVSFVIALVYLVLKCLFWERFRMGLAPLLIGIFMLGSIELLVMGVLGEYINAILTRVSKRPMVIEEERINFGDEKNI